MKYFLCVCLLALLVACQPTSTLPETDPLPQENDVLVEDMVKTPEPPKLELLLLTEKTTGQLPFETSISTKTTIPTDRITWQLDGEPLDCQTTCQIHLDLPGIYVLEVTAVAKKQTTTKELAFEITKKQEDITQVIALGDSLTAGHGLDDPAAQSWVSLLAKNLDADVQNFAVSGATSSDLRFNQLPNYASTSNKKIIFVWIGANDIIKFVPLDAYKQHVDQVLSQLPKDKNTHIVVLTIPDASKLGIADDIEEQANALLSAFGVEEISVKEIGKDIILQYNAALIEVATKHNMKTIDMFSHMEQFDQSWVSNDQFHPNAAGHERIAALVTQDLQELYPLTDFT